MKKEILKRAVIGFVLGMAVGNLIAFFYADKSADPVVIVTPLLSRRTGSVTAALIIQTILSGLMGAVSFAGTIFYDFEDWGMTKTMVMHYLLIILIYFPVAFWCGWIDPEWKEILIRAVIMAFEYLVIWLIMYIRYRIQTKELNRMMESYRDQASATGQTLKIRH